MSKDDDQGGKHGEGGDHSRGHEHGGRSRDDAAGAGAVGHRPLVHGSLGPDGQLRVRFDWARSELEAVGARHLPRLGEAITGRTLGDARSATYRIEQAFRIIERELEGAESLVQRSGIGRDAAELVELGQRFAVLRLHAAPTLALAPSAAQVASEPVLICHGPALHDDHAAHDHDAERRWHAQLDAHETKPANVIEASHRFGGDRVAAMIDPPAAIDDTRATIDDSPRAATVQRRATGDACDDVKIPQRAAAGVSGAGGRLPHLDAIQRSFGGHDITGVVAHVGGRAADAAASIGAEAYATGNSVAFAAEPSLFVAAHEAAHVVQQRAGVHLLGGVGQAGDVYETHADAVADRVVRGESAADLLGAPGSRAAGTAVQRKAGDPRDAATPIPNLTESTTHASAPAATTTGTPRKKAKTQSHKEAATFVLLKQYKVLYKKIRIDLKALATTEGVDADAAHTLVGDFLEAKGLYTQMSAKSRTSAEESEAEDIKYVIDRLYEDALPVLQRHGAIASTGVGVVDAGFGCDQDATKGCYLTDAKRTMLWAAFGLVVNTAMASFRDAIQNKRLDKMLEKSPSSGWGFMAEFLFYSVTGPLIAAAVKGLKSATKGANAMKAASELAETGYGALDAPQVSAFAKLIAAVPEEDAAAALQNASRGLRTHLKNKAYESSSDRPWDAFLKIMQDGIKAIGDNLVLDAPAKWNDAELVAMVQGYRDPVAHGVPSYEHYLDDMLSRFQGQALDKIGDTWTGGGKTKVVILEAYGQRRTAILGVNGTKQTGTSMHGESRGEKQYGDGRSILQGFVDEDLAEFAHQLSGGSEEVISIESGVPFEFATDDKLIQTNNAEHRLKAWLKTAKAEQDVKVTAIGPTVTEVPIADQIGHSVEDMEMVLW